MFRVGAQALESVGTAVKGAGTAVKGAGAAVCEAGMTAVDSIHAKLHTGAPQNTSNKDDSTSEKIKNNTPASPTTAKFAKVPMDLKAFMLRAEVLKLYRHILRSLRDVPSTTDRQQLQQWARQEFELNRHLTDDYAVKLALHNGRKSFERLSRNIVRAK